MIKPITTISFFTLGCRLNQSETAVIEQSFEKQGYKIVSFDSPSDICVINTCTVTENGDADTRYHVNRAHRLNPSVQIALIGCQAQIQKEKLAKLPNVRWIVGNEKKMDLSTIVKEYRAQFKTHVITPTISRKSFTIENPSIDSHHTRANLKIQDGCDFFCSFCEIPYARGRARSREFQDLLKEANILVDAGHKELILTGINIGTYKNNNKNLLSVIDALENIPGLERIRISSIEPTTIPFELIKKMGKSSKLCRYLHIPLQSADDYVLKTMNRKYTTHEFSEFINKVKVTVPEICIGTDVIVGFPDEGEREFNNSLDFIREQPIDYVHVFSYSKRHLAKSKHSNKAVENSVIHKRSQMLQELSNRKRSVFYQSFLGTTQNVLFERKKNDYWPGVTDNYIRVKIKSEKNVHNQILPVKLVSIEENNILGTISL